MFKRLMAVLAAIGVMLIGFQAPAQAYPGFTNCQTIGQVTVKVTWETRTTPNGVPQARARAVYAIVKSGTYNFRNTNASLVLVPAGQWPDDNTFMFSGYSALYSGTFFFGDGYYLGDDGTEPWLDYQTGNGGYIGYIEWAGDAYFGNTQHETYVIKVRPTSIPLC